MNRGITIGSVAIALLVFAGVSIGFIAMIGDVTSNYDTSDDVAIAGGENLSDYNESVRSLKDSMQGFSGNLEGQANQTRVSQNTGAQLLWLGVSQSFGIKGVLESMFGVVGGITDIGQNILHLPDWVPALAGLAFAIVIGILIWRVILSETRI